MALGALTKLKIPTQTLIYESLLQIICNNINCLTIDDIISLQIDLKHAEKTPLVEAIQTALPIIFEVQLPKIDKSNINLLALCLVFATKLKNKNDKSINFIVQNISEYKNEIPVSTAKLIFNSLTFVADAGITYRKLILWMQDILLEEVSSLSYADAIIIFRSIANAE